MKGGILYIMSSVVKSISVSIEEDDFLKTYNLSPSQLIKEKIWEMKGMIINITGSKIESLTSRIEQQAREIEDLKNELAKKKE